MTTNMKATLNINRKATLQRVRSFFNYNYPNYLNLSDLTNYELKSIDYTQPHVIQTRRTDALEKLITQQIEANLIVMSVQQAINKCPDRPQAPYKTILTERYLKFHPAWQVALKIQYSSSQYNKLQNRALLLFAKKFIIQQLINKVSQNSLIDLHIYEDRDTNYKTTHKDLE